MLDNNTWTTTYKIIFLLCCLFISLIQADANENREIAKITVEFKNQSLDSTLCQLEKQSGYRFFYQDKIVGNPATTDWKFENKTMSEILDILLAKAEYDYAFFCKREIVVIYRKTERSFKTGLKQEPALFTATGIVVDEKDNVVPGASVYIKGEDIETNISTDENGSFTISTTNPDVYLIVLYLGYIPRIIHIQNVELIKIEPDMEMLNKIITTGGTGEAVNN